MQVSRATVLLLLAIVLGVVPLYLSNQAQANCARTSGQEDSGLVASFFSSGTDVPESCVAANASLPSWAHLAGFVSAIFFCGWLALGARSIYDRNQERAVIRAVRQAELNGRNSDQ